MTTEDIPSCYNGFMSVVHTEPEVRRYRNVADLVHALGDIPLERIICDPSPGTATEADLLRRVELEKQLCELVNGTLVEKPMGLIESLIAARLIKALLMFVEP